jgi:hypothetical protein
MWNSITCYWCHNDSSLVISHLVIKLFPPGGRCPQVNNYPYLFIYLLIYYLFIYISFFQSHSTSHANPPPLAVLTWIPSGRICSHTNPVQVMELRFYSDTVKSRSVGWPDENGGWETVWTLSWHNIKVRHIPKSHGNSHSEESVSGPRRGHPSALTPTTKLRLWN